MPGLERTDIWQGEFSFARPYFEQAVSRGLSFTAFYEEVRGTGISYRRERMLQDWGEVAGKYRYQAAIQGLASETRISWRYTTESALNQTEPFLATVKYTYTDALTGEDKEGYRMISSRSLLARGTYERTAAAAFSPGRMYADPTARDFQLVAITRRGGLEEEEYEE